MRACQEVLAEIYKRAVPSGKRRCKLKAVSAFDDSSKALRTLCVRDGRALQDIAHASKISPAMLSSLGFPRQEFEKVFVEQLARLGLRPKGKAEESAAPRAKPRKASKA